MTAKLTNAGPYLTVITSGKLQKGNDKMRIKRVFGKKQYNKELTSIARISGEICFLDKMVSEKKKSWNDVQNKAFYLKHILDEKICRFSSHKENSFNQGILSFAEYVHSECLNFIERHR